GGTPNDSDATLTYQWQYNDGVHGWQNITTNGTGSTYTVTEANEGSQRQAVIPPHATHGTGSRTTSTATTAVTDITPALTAATIAGSAHPAHRPSDPGGTPNDSDATLTYQWQYNDGVHGWQNITTNGTGSTYTVTE